VERKKGEEKISQHNLIMSTGNRWYLCFFGTGGVSMLQICHTGWYL